MSERIDLRKQARNLHRAGNTLGMIVKVLGVPKTTVHRWVTSQNGAGTPPPTPSNMFIPPDSDAGLQVKGGQAVPTMGHLGAPTAHSHSRAPNSSSIAAWQMPNASVKPVIPSSPSTLIVPYPVEQPPHDSLWQVFLDAIRAKLLGQINQQYQLQPPPVTITSYPENPTPSDAKSHDNEDWMNKMSAKVESLGRTLEEQAQQREEKRAKRLKELQEDIDQFRKNQKSKNPEPEPVNKTGATVTQEQNDSKSGSSGLTVDNNTGTVVTGVTAQSGPPPPLVGTLNTARANIQPDPAPKSPLTPTPQPPTSPPMAGGAKEGQIDSKNELSGSLTNTTRSTEDNRPAAILPVTQSDDRMLLYVAAGSVLIATEPWWRPKVEAFLNRTFAKLMPTHPTPTPEATPFPVQKETRLYDTPTIRRDNIF